MKFPRTVRTLIGSWHIWVASYGVRNFTFIPRRFTTHYWDTRHCLIMVTWWQWFRRCFCIRDRVINRPEYSSWPQICQRANNGDRDAKLIYLLVQDIKVRVVTDDLHVIYDKMVTTTGN